MPMGKRLPLVDYSLCVACGSCLPACPFSCLELSRLGLDSLGTAFPELAKPSDCTGCSLCAKACPVECISMDGPPVAPVGMEPDIVEGPGNPKAGKPGA